MANILVIEDNDAQRAALEEFLGTEHTVYAAPDGELARAVMDERRVDLVISDLMLPDTTGIEIVKQVRRDRPELPFLILTGEPSIESAVQAMQEGADDYLTKPVDLRVLERKAMTLLESGRLREENANLRKRIADTFQSDNIIGNSEGLRGVLEKCKQVAPTDVTVLIEGESGTGKELIANLLHENSPRTRGPFMRINCGAIAKSLLESELFGAVKGAYTGADRSRAGYFESADGGTIFLDEIGEMDAESQVRLLRVLEEREVMRIGSTKAVPVDVRVIAATNKDLLDQVEDGDFREDLYYRLAVIRLSLPALRERRADLSLLFNHFIVQFNEKYGKSVSRVEPELWQFFQAYHWPGNIRQFRNVLEGMVVLATDDTLLKENLPEELRRSPRANQNQLQTSVVAGISLEDYEKAIIAKNLELNAGNREKTAGILGISERTLYRKLKEYDLG